jgi:transposase InsO family protein
MALGWGAQLSLVNLSSRLDIEKPRRTSDLGQVAGAKHLYRPAAGAVSHRSFESGTLGRQSLCVALVVDVFSRRIVGWRAATETTTPLV